MGSKIDEERLLELPIFAGLSAGEIGGLSAHTRMENHYRDSYVFKRGAEGDSLYVVLSGQIALELDGKEGRRLLALSGPGDWFGELALLNSEPRSADARVTVDAKLLRINRDGWAALNEQAPRLFARLCARIGTHLRATNEAVRASRRTIVACGEPGEANPTWLLPLFESVRRQFPDREAHALAADGTALSQASVAQPPHPFPARLASAVARILHPDALIFVPADAGSEVADQRLRRVGATEFALERSGEPHRCARIRGATEDAVIDRVARHVAGGTVGLALGAGGAFGLAHLGLVQALAVAGVPIDYVSGTSMGAVVGAIVAAGVSPERAIQWARSGGPRYLTMLVRDLSVRGPTLLSGSTFMQAIGEIEALGDATFETLQVPFAAVAMDVSAGEAVVIDSGPLLEGIRPSFAMPGIFPPCTVGSRLLVDGATVDPVPVDVARSLGADAVIASQPIPPLQPDVKDPVGRFLERVEGFTRLVRLSPVRDRIQTLNVSLRSFQALWYRLAAVSVLSAEVAFCPDLREFWFLQFGAAEQIVASGQAQAEAMVPEIRETLRRRIGLAV